MCILIDSTLLAPEHAGVPRIAAGRSRQQGESGVAAGEDGARLAISVVTMTSSSTRRITFAPHPVSELATTKEVLSNA
jgi:hypothetical protein